MYLPAAVEYLLTLRGAGGAQLVYSGVSRLTFPFVLPNQVLRFTWAGTDYCYILYGISFSPEMVPSAFWYRCQYLGYIVFDGYLTQWDLENPVPMLIAHTQSSPALGTITNMTALNQFYDGRTFYVGIRTKDDYQAVLEALSRYAGASPLVEDLAKRLGQAMGAGV